MHVQEHRVAIALLEAVGTHQPSVDLRAVLRESGEPLRLAQGAVARDVRDTPAFGPDVELACQLLDSG